MVWGKKKEEGNVLPETRQMLPSQRHSEEKEKNITMKQQQIRS